MRNKKGDMGVGVIIAGLLVLLALICTDAAGRLDKANEDKVPPTEQVYR